MTTFKGPFSRNGTVFFYDILIIAKSINFLFELFPLAEANNRGKRMLPLQFDDSDDGNF